jgi:hypothetical protein
MPGEALKTPLEMGAEMIRARISLENPLVFVQYAGKYIFSDEWLAARVLAASRPLPQCRNASGEWLAM